MKKTYSSSFKKDHREIQKFFFAKTNKDYEYLLRKASLGPKATEAEIRALCKEMKI